MNKQTNGTLIAILAGVLANTSACGSAGSVSDHAGEIQGTSQDLAAQAMIDRINDSGPHPASTNDKEAELLRSQKAAMEAGLVFPACSSFIFHSVPETKLESCIWSNGIVTLDADSTGPISGYFDISALSVVDLTTGVALWPYVVAVRWGASSITSVLTFKPIPGHTYAAAAALHDRFASLPEGWFYPVISPRMGF